MSERHPTISDADELLGLLRADPHFRGVVYVNDESLAVCEFKDGDPRSRGYSRVVAWIAESGTAYDILVEAHANDGNPDMAAWLTRPLRHGPYCSTWVLPEHPRAPEGPGQE
jgi:hypothetical protein